MKDPTENAFTKRVIEVFEKTALPWSTGRAPINATYAKALKGGWVPDDIYTIQNFVNGVNDRVKKGGIRLPPDLKLPTVDELRELAEKSGMRKSHKDFTEAKRETRRLPSTDSSSKSVRYYMNDHDEDLDPALEGDIKSAHNEITMVSLGLSKICGHGHRWCQMLVQQVERNPALHLHFLLADPENLALKTRYDEEIRAQGGKSYIHGWPTIFFEFARNGLTTDLRPSVRPRIHVQQLAFFPMLTVLKLDEIFYVRPYARPDLGGWACPWTRYEGNGSEHPMVSFLRSFCAYSKAHVLKEPQTDRISG